jgi:hypothetical protein
MEIPLLNHEVRRWGRMSIVIYIRRLENIPSGSSMEIVKLKLEKLEIKKNT